jgi:hypothetical protein
MPFLSSVEKYGYMATAGVPKTSVTFVLPNLAGNGQLGIANEIFALRDITITRFSVLLTAGGTVRVFFKAGTIASNFNQGGWTFAGSTNISSTGLQDIPIPLNIVVPANTSMSFLITSGSLSYTNGVSVGSTHASNSHIQVRSGYGTGNIEPPLTNVFSPRNFNGSITYEF